VIQVRLKGEFGDRIFQYCMGRILASRWGYAMSPTPIAGLRQTFRRIDGREILHPYLYVTGNDLMDQVRHQPLSHSVRESGDGSRTILDGSFQRWEFFVSDIQNIRNWIIQNDAPLETTSDLAICIANKFSVCNQKTISVRKYLDWLASQDCTIILERPDMSLWDLLRSLGCRVFVGLPHEILRFTARFDRIVLGPSSLFWWGAFLSYASKIYWPQEERIKHESDTYDQPSLLFPNIQEQCPWE
jgi:hypothetical protein